MRVKQDYVLTENQKGKLEPQKVGLKAIQRDGVDYEFTLVFELDNSNFASVSKDRTGQFWNQPDFKISVETGKQIREWCEEGVSVDQVKKLIAKTKTLQELTDLYKQYPAYLPLLRDEFSKRKEQLANNIISPFKTNPNGIHHH
jgi:hypothetical protein